MVVRDGKVVKVVQGATHVARPEYDPAIETRLTDHFDRYHTMRMENFRVLEQRDHRRAVAAGSRSNPPGRGSHDHQGRHHRGHLRRGLRHEGDPPDHHRRHPRWAETARSLTGFATSVIACGAEAGIESVSQPERDARRPPGRTVLIFAINSKELQKQLQIRVGQCVLTTPGSACFSGLEAEKRIGLGQAALFRRRLPDRRRCSASDRYWRIPVMDGEFVCEDTIGVVTDAVGGGNVLILGNDRAGLLTAAEAAVAAIGDVPDMITPFPGGVVRSGSKVGSKYKGMVASTNDAFCPTLQGRVKSELGPDTVAVLEFVIDGLTSRRRRRHERRLEDADRDWAGDGRHDHRRQLRRQARPASQFHLRELLP